MATQLASLYVKISAESSQLEKALKGVKGDLTSAEKGFATFESIATKGLVAIGLAATAAFAAVGAGVAKAIKAAADFEQGVADIGAVMSLTAKEAEGLEEHILDLGLDPKLKVTATEAAEAIMSLGTAGLNMTQIMGGASKATVLLSNATGGDMANSAELLTDIMSQFNIEAGNTSRVVDQVTGLTVASKFAFNDAALAIAQAGGMAGSTGVEFEDFNAILGVTAANFSSGSDAGTSLKTFLTTLVPKSNEAADKMRELGLYTGLTGKEFTDTQEKIAKLRKRIEELDPTSKKYSDNVNKLNAEINALNGTLIEGNNGFFDSNGMMLDAETIAGNLQRAFAGLSDERKNDALATIFGNDAMRTAAGLIEAGTEGIIRMKEEIGKVDAEEIAANRMDTFAGAIEVAQGVMETISISIGQKFLPVLRPLVEQFATLAQTHGPKLIDFFGRFAEKLGHIISQGLDWMMRNLPPIWQNLKDIGTAVNTVTNMIFQALSPLTKFEGGWVKWHDVALAVGILLAGPVVAALAGLVSAMAPAIVLVTKISVAIAVMREAWDTNFLGIQDMVSGALNYISKFLQNHTSIWKGSWGKTLEYFKTNSREAWTKLRDDIVSKFNSWTREVRHIVETWIATTERKINNWIAVQRSAFDQWVIFIKRKFGEWGESAEQLLARFIPQQWIDKGKAIIQGLWDGIKNTWQRLSDWFSGVWKDLTDRFKRFFGIHSPSTLFRTYGEDMMAGLRAGIDAGSGIVFDSMDRMVGGIAGKLETIPGLVDKSMAALAQQAMDAKMKLLQELSKPIIPDWAKPDYKPPASTMPPVLADPNAGTGGIVTVIPKTSTPGNFTDANWLSKTMDQIINFKFSGSPKFMEEFITAVRESEWQLKLMGVLNASTQAVIDRLTGDIGSMTAGQVTSDLGKLAQEVWFHNQNRTERDPQMERNNQLLEILINELRNKNLTTTVNLAAGTGGSYADLVQFAAAGAH